MRPALGRPAALLSLALLALPVAPSAAGSGGWRQLERTRAPAGEMAIAGGVVRAPKALRATVDGRRGARVRVDASVSCRPGPRGVASTRRTVRLPARVALARPAGCGRRAVSISASARGGRGALTLRTWRRGGRTVRR